MSWGNIKSSSLLKSVAILATGTAVGQLITVASSPILTRLYSPESFGLFAVFMALVTTLSAAVCGQYEVAIVVPKKNSHGRQLFAIAVQFSVVVSMMYLIFLLLVEPQVPQFISIKKLSSWIYLAPFSLLLTGVLGGLGYYANRLGEYGKIAKSKMLQAFVMACISIGLGLISAEFVGLLLGYVLGLVGAAIYLFRVYKSELAVGLFGMSRTRRALAWRYREYPLYSGSSSLLYGVTMNLPVFFLTYYYSNSVVGFFALVVRVIWVPFGLISASVSQVNLKKVVDLVNVDMPIRPYLLKITGVLIGIVSIPAILLMLFSPWFFSILFGGEWYEAGVYLQILMPAYAIRFVVATLSGTIWATNHNSYLAIWRVVGFFITFAVFFIFAPLGDIVRLLTVLMLSDVILYIFYYILIWHAARHSIPLRVART